MLINKYVVTFVTLPTNELYGMTFCICIVVTCFLLLLQNSVITCLVYLVYWYTQTTMSKFLDMICIMCYCDIIVYSLIPYICTYLCVLWEYS